LEFPVTLKEYSTEADPVTQTFAATFSLEVPEEQVVLPGMTATVLEYAAPRGGGGVVLLPLDVVPTASDGGYFVWRVRDLGEGTAVVEKNPVEVGALSGDEVEILAGLKPGERIAAAGVSLLREGQVVRPIE
jgi:multidrug efflux pump subunit AcrA (membrane-fusion protein)